MRIIIATPLYPPDTAGAAQYAKELARRLAATHTVHVLAYGTLPEVLPGVSVTVVPKRYPALVRVPLFTLALVYHAFFVDRVLCINGHSVEIPLLVTALVAKTVLIDADPDARIRTAGSPVWNTTAHLARTTAHTCITELPDPRPEILPLAPRPEAALTAYEASWSTHLRALSECLT